MPRIIIIREKSEDCFGGIERQILHIAKGLEETGGLEPILLTSDRDTVFASIFEGLGFPVEEVPNLSTSVFGAAALVGQIVRRYRATVVQSHMFRESIVARALRLQSPDLVHIFRVHTYIDCSWIPGWKKWSYHALDKLTNRGVDCYAAITHYARSEMISRSLITPGRVTVVPDGVPQLGTPDAVNMDSGPLPLKVAMVSNFVGHKGHDVLIRCLAELKRRGCLVQARLVGGEHTVSRNTCGVPHTDGIRKMAQEAGVLDQIEFTGFTENVYEAIREYPVVVLPSDSEGLPNCILEAMSVRKLVVASGVGGVPEIVTDEENGLLHAVQDHVGLANILTRVFTSPAHSWEGLRNRGLETWRSRFSVESMIQGLIEIYREAGVLG